MDRRARRFFGVGKLVSEKVKVAKCCMVLVRQLCHTCDNSKIEFGYKVLDTENEKCLSCVKRMYKEIYQTDCKSL